MTKQLPPALMRSTAIYTYLTLHTLCALLEDGNRTSEGKRTILPKRGTQEKGKSLTEMSLARCTSENYVNGGHNGVRTSSVNGSACLRMASSVRVRGVRFRVAVCNLQSMTKVVEGHGTFGHF